MKIFLRYAIGFGYRKVMFMKKIILLLTLILIGFGVFSQTLPIDSRLYARYSEEELQNMQQNNPEDLEYFNWFVENSYVIKTVANPGTLDYPKLRYLDNETKSVGCEVTEFNADNFNIMEYAVNVEPKKSVAYVIGNTGKVLVFYSKEYLTELYNEYRRKRYENQ